MHYQYSFPFLSLYLSSFKVIVLTHALIRDNETATSAINAGLHFILEFTSDDRPLFGCRTIIGCGARDAVPGSLLLQICENVRICSGAGAAPETSP